MVTCKEKKLLELTFAEFEGIGTWYEYLVKYKLFKKLKNINSVLLAGLPQEYGIASDILLFAIHGSKLTVIDDRKDKLNQFMKLAKKFKAEKNVKTIYHKNLEKFPFKDNTFDLVTNTETIQRVNNFKKMIKEMERTTKKHVFLFVPNAYYYSHYIITKIKTFKMNKIIKHCNLEIKNKDYLDRPPWPAGINVSAGGISFTQGSKSNQRENFEAKGIKESFFISSLKTIFIFLTPALVLLESFYPPPLKELLSHMFFVHMVKLPKNL